MIKINRTLEYAMMALKFMSKKEGLCSAKEISENLHISFDTTARVMQFMAQSGILKAEYGAGGGYFLLKKLADVSLDELVTSVEGPITLVKCMNPQAQCDIQSQCSILGSIGFITEKLIEMCRSINLEELLASQSQVCMKAVVDSSESSVGSRSE